jgi:hypothetical protein
LLNQKYHKVNKYILITITIYQFGIVVDETEQQKALLMKVLQLTDEQINELPPQTRDQIRQLVKKRENYEYIFTESLFVFIYNRRPN